MSLQKYLVVFNPLAGKKGQRYLAKVRQALDHANTPYDIYHTKQDSAADEANLKIQVNSYSDIISMGGDGTLNMLCNVLAHKDIPLGIIPCGTGNDFTRNIYDEEQDIISVVTGSRVKSIDLGHCNDRYFINILGIGYDAMMVRNTMYDSKGMFRSLFYLWNALKYLPFYKEESVHIKSAKLVKNDKTFIAAFGNGAFFGNGMKITPKADITDGLLDCCWIGKLSFLQKCHCLWRSFKGEHLGQKNIDYTQAEEFHVLSGKHLIEADGEFIGYTPATIRVAKKALVLKVL